MSKALFVLAILAGLVAVGIGLVPVKAKAPQLGVSVGPLTAGSANESINCGSPLAPAKLKDDALTQAVDAVLRLQDRCDAAVESRAQLALVVGLGAAALAGLALVGAILGGLGRLLFRRTHNRSDR